MCFMERLCFCLSLLGCQDDNCVEIVWTNEVRANAQQEVRKPPRGHGFAVVQHKIRFQRSAMLKRYRLKIKADAYLLTLWSALLLTFGFALSKGISAFSLRWGYSLHVHRAHHSFLISERLKHKGRGQGFIFWGQQQQQQKKIWPYPLWIDEIPFNCWGFLASFSIMGCEKKCGEGNCRTSQYGWSWKKPLAVI